MKNHGWCLRKPGGKLVPETFDLDKDSAWCKAFRYLETKSWMEPYWKNWDGSLKAARERSWVLVPVRLEEVS